MFNGDFLRGTADFGMLTMNASADNLLTTDRKYRDPPVAILKSIPRALPTPTTVHIVVPIDTLVRHYVTTLP